MRAMFVARGPAFPHPEGSRVAEFQNTEIYNIVCDTLGIEPKGNNGTLRLPFQTKGKHDFASDGALDVEVPHDPQEGVDEVENLNDFLAAALICLLLLLLRRGRRDRLRQRSLLELRFRRGPLCTMG